MEATKPPTRRARRCQNSYSYGDGSAKLKTPDGTEASNNRVEIGSQLVSFGSAALHQQQSVHVNVETVAVIHWCAQYKKNRGQTVLTRDHSRNYQHIPAAGIILLAMIKIRQTLYKRVITNDARLLSASYQTCANSSASGSSCLTLVKARL